MRKLILAVAALSLSASATAQSAQERLDTRYDRALAAGYKALFLCSAIANAEANGTTRTPESVHEWELTGIQQPLDGMIREMEYEIVRRPTGQIAHVQVAWADDMPDRVAAYYGTQTGCSIWPIGAAPELNNSEVSVEVPSDEDVQEGGALDGLVLEVRAADGSSLADRPPSSLTPAFDGALGALYGSGRTTAVLVRKLDVDGEGWSETARYAPGFTEDTPQRTWSVAKSIASTLVGMAVHSGEFAVEE
ncbi:MAG: serine hydrolase, partial [Pseudomonadota bacterium]